MAEYYVEWTEHHKKRARIQAPPNDQRVLDAAKTYEIHPEGIVADTPVIIVWADVDGKIERVEDADGKPDVTYEITLVGKQVEIPCGKDLIEQRIVPL